MRLLLKNILLAVFLCMFLVPASAFASQYTVYAGELPPFNYKAESGHAEGIAIDLLVEIMKDVGSPIAAEDILCIDWPMVSLIMPLLFLPRTNQSTQFD